MTFLGLTSHSPLALNLTAGFGVFQLTLGLTGVFRPQTMLSVWGVETSVTSAKDQTLIEALMQLYGARNIALGIMILAVRNLGDSRTLGACVLADSIVALVDGFAQKKATRGGQWKHWSFLPIGGGLAMALLGYFD